LGSPPVIDGHAHLQSELPVEGAVRAMDEAGVAQALVMACLRDPLPAGAPAVKRVLSALLSRGDTLHRLGRWAYAGLVEGARRVVGETGLGIRHAPDNEAVARAVARYPSRLRGLYFVNPLAEPDARRQVSELERYVGERGFVGAKAHVWWYRYRLVRGLMPVARWCAARRRPLLVHLGGTPESSAVAGLWGKLPQLPIIVAHGGVPLFSRLWEQARSAPNVYVDLAGAYVTPALMREAARVLGPERLVFGSDAPSGLRHGGGHAYRPLLAAVRALPLRAEAIEGILGGNLARVLDGVRQAA
jgi:predicted TIM-barrel fold metal-dependent hydrolase